MFTLVALSKALTSALGIALLLSWPGSSSPHPNDQIGNPTFTRALVLPQPRSSTHRPSPNVTEIATPNFTQVYEVVANLEAEPDIPGPFGRRVSHGFLGGNVTDAKTGALVGHVVPGVGGDFGLFSNVNGKLYTDLSFVVQWLDDKKLAYIILNGIGQVANNTGTATSYARIETDSASRQNLVDNFLLMRFNIPNPSVTPTIGYFTLFSKST
ncbi:hypothetical protein GYMLUDRAFT_249194 [Collybiopsis luxurians FD-317 M1]|uniref:Dirigent protein n=1 Tax=Collybiopsis luxurians FD-317 M1 TaxID=944289 RepID=A0A0D0CIL7_9AGAR|nr:hypothetical protein GYMLUDRAFT_249194 [Collybiopsis luxurians FD-317 M1]